MRKAISGIALNRGLILRTANTTCTAKRNAQGQIFIKIKKQDPLMKKLQGLGLLVIFILAMLPDGSKTPESTFYSLLLPMILFLVILRLIPRLRILNYHGAEHKVVVAYINKTPLTLEAVKPFSRVTKVCGTMMLLPILFYISLLSLVSLFTQNTLIHMVLTLLALLLIGHYFCLRGESVTYLHLYRLIPFLKKKAYRLKTNALYKIFDQVGYGLQRYITTREPSDEELAVAILCMQRLVDTEKESPI